MSHKTWLVLLASLGVVFGVSYLYLANKLCSVEQSSLNLNWRLVPDLNKNEKHQSAAYRYGRKKDQGEHLPSYSLVQQEEAKENTDHSEAKGNVWLTKFACDAKLSDLLIALFTYGLFIATGWLVWATLKLWRAAQDTAETQERDTRILQRAYISVEPGGVHAHNARGRIYLKGDKGPPQSVPQIRIVNVGHLPARDIKWIIEHKFSEDRRLNDFPIDEDRGEGRNVLPPGGFMTQGGIIINVGEKEPGELRLETDRFLYVWGIVIYDNGFGETRRTRFCHRYNSVNLDYVYDEEHPLSDGRKVWIGREIKSEFARYHRYGNDAD
ncbi:hypothetical protein ACVWYH_008432 [Bradyrhizobium sp. GM24.11]